MPRGLKLTVYFLGAALLAYCAMASLVWAMQGRLIYPAPPVRTDVPVGVERVVYRTQDGIDITAGYVAPRDDMPTIVFFHGNGADFQSSLQVTKRMAKWGFGILAAEYRGYGGNAGVPSEEGFYEDGRAALAFLKQRGVPMENTVLLGNSIGSGVAVQMASENDVRALVLISPFDSLTNTAARALRWLPVRLLLKDRFDNQAKLGDLEMPILIMHGDADTLILPSQAQALSQKNERVRLLMFEGKGHDLAGHAEIYSQVADFIYDAR